MTALQEFYRRKGIPFPDNDDDYEDDSNDEDADFYRLMLLHQS